MSTTITSMPAQITSALATMELQNQRVFVRADLNVTLLNGTLLDDYRLQKILPTINLVHQKGGLVVLATHIARPEQPNPALSTKNLVPWFEHRGYQVIFEEDLSRAATQSRLLRSPALLLLENLRFFPGEKHHEFFFAQQLRACADIFVNDAFGVLHRNDTSITLLPSLFDRQKRTIGLLVERELTMLNQLMNNPPRPFMLILGGGKVSDKIPLIEQLLNRINTLVLCPAPVFTFLKAQKKPIGKSLIDERHITQCVTILRKAQELGVTVLMPQDYLIAYNNMASGPLEYVDAQCFPEHGIGISIGNKTLDALTPYIQKAGTIFYTGAMGMLERPETLVGMVTLFNAIAQSNAFTVIGGGSSAAVARRYNMIDQFDHVSTGGGATLAYLSGKPLPGLQALTA